MGLCCSASTAVDPKDAPTTVTPASQRNAAAPAPAPAAAKAHVPEVTINPNPQLPAGRSGAINPGQRGGSSANLRLQLSNPVHTGSGVNLAGMVASPGGTMAMPTGTPMGMSRRVSSLTAIDPRALKELPAAALIAAALNDAAYFSNILTAIARKSGVLSVPLADAQKAGLVPHPAPTTGAGAIVSSSPAPLALANRPGGQQQLKQLSDFHRLVEQLAYAKEDKLCHGEDVIEIAAAAGSADVLDILLSVAPQLVTHKKADTGNTLLHFAALGPIHVASVYDNLRVHLQHDTEVMSVLAAAGVAVGGAGNSPQTPGGRSVSAPAGSTSAGPVGLELDGPTANSMNTGGSQGAPSRPTSLRITAPGPATGGSLAAPFTPGGTNGTATPGGSVTGSGSAAKKRSTGVQYMQQLLQLYLQQQGMLPKQPSASPTNVVSTGTTPATGAAATTAAAANASAAALPAGAATNATASSAAQANGGLKRSGSFFNDHGPANPTGNGNATGNGDAHTAAASAAAPVKAPAPAEKAVEDKEDTGMIRLPPRNALSGASFFGTGLGLDGHHDFSHAANGPAPSSTATGETAGAPAPVRASPPTLPAAIAVSTGSDATGTARSTSPDSVSSAGSSSTITSSVISSGSVPGVGAGTGSVDPTASPPAPAASTSTAPATSATTTTTTTAATAAAPAPALPSSSPAAAAPAPVAGKRPPSHPLSALAAAAGADSDGLSSHDLMATAAHNRLRMSITQAGGASAHPPNPFSPHKPHGVGHHPTGTGTGSGPHGPSSLAHPSLPSLAEATNAASTSASSTAASGETVAVVAAPTVLSLSELSKRFPPRSIEKTVRVLLKHGANAGVKNVFGKVPRDAALSQARQASLHHTTSGSTSALPTVGVINAMGMGGGVGGGHSSSNLIGLTASAHGSTSSLPQAAIGTAPGSSGTGTITFSPSGLSASGGSCSNLSGLTTSACVASAAYGLLAEGSLFDRLLKTIPVDWDEVADLLKPNTQADGTSSTGSAAGLIKSASAAAVSTPPGSVGGPSSNAASPPAIGLSLSPGAGVQGPSGNASSAKPSATAI